MSGGADRKLLVFELCGQRCALPIEAVREIVPAAALARSPGQPSLLEGFLNLRGTAVPVLRLHRLFDLPPAPLGLHTPLIVLRDGGYPTALLVDRVLDIVSVGSEALLPVEERNCFNDCVEAQVVLEGGSAYLISRERLLLEKERQCVAELQARAQHYLAELEGEPA